MLRPRNLAVALIAVAATLALTASVAFANKHVTVKCKGTENQCVAKVSLAGGASNEKVKIKLPGTSWKKPRVHPSHKSLRGAYSLSHRRFAKGGSVYKFTLNAVQSIKTGKLKFTFTGK